MLVSTLPSSEIDDCWNRIGVRGDHSCPELEKHLHCRNCPVHADAAARLLDSAAPAAYLADWTRHYAQPRVEAETNALAFFIFRIGSEWFGLPVAALREIAPLRPIHSLPHRLGNAVLGVANIRGELLVCLALDRVLGLDATATPERGAKRLELRRLLVVSAEGGPLAFPVDEAYGIHTCSSSMLAAVPATVGRATAAHTRAVLSWKGHTVGCLDLPPLLATLNRSLA